MWLSLGGGRANPPDAQWRAQSFVFHDETGAQVQLTGDAVLDTAGQLGYTYEGVAAAAVFLEGAAEAVSEPSSPDRQPEFVGASERPIDLAGAPTSIDVVIDRRTVAARARELAQDVPTHVYLNI